MKTHPIVLIILDGFGLRESNDSNAINLAQKPVWDELWNTYPHTSLNASGLSVGLPEGQMGNSEVGHLTMGAGRIIYQDLTRISEDIKNGNFFQNSIIISALDKAKKTNRAVHVLGLLSPGGVHSHEDHIFALLQLANERGVPKVWIHPFLDGRDNPPEVLYLRLKNWKIFVRTPKMNPHSNPHSNPKPNPKSNPKSKSQVFVVAIMLWIVINAGIAASKLMICSPI